MSLNAISDGFQTDLSSEWENHCTVYCVDIHFLGYSVE